MTKSIGTDAGVPCELPGGSTARVESKRRGHIQMISLALVAATPGGA